MRLYLGSHLSLSLILVLGGEGGEVVIGVTPPPQKCVGRFNPFVKLKNKKGDSPMDLKIRKWSQEILLKVVGA